MKLLLIKRDDEHYALPVDEVKLINKDVTDLPEEIRYSGKTIPVLNNLKNNEKESLSKEELLNYIKELISTGESEDLENMIKELRGGESKSEGGSEATVEVSENVYTSLKEIVESINDFKKTAVSKLDQSLGNISDDVIPETSDQLQAIVHATENATNTIIDITEKMQDSNTLLHSEMSKIHEMKEKLERGLVGVINVMDSVSKIREENDGYLTTILEALSFQDITGQRVNKIVNIVSKMDHNIKEIILDLGLKIKKKNKDSDPEAIKKGEELLALMKGPQENGVNQDDVDDLIANFL